jgi:CDP-6-deoxy-D-xylo-4-hexulose-3-dehydrase
MEIILVKNDSSCVRNLNHPLMENNITREDLDELITYLQDEEPRLTQGENVAAFEREWSDWLGVKYSVFVNSGSSANLITLAVVKQLYGVGEIIVPPLTWASDITACLHNGFDPVFVDINPRTLGLDTLKVLEKINDSTKAVFITHVQGFNALTDELLDVLDKRNIALIEDVCESHGATYRNKKLGAFGLMSNFSFYFAHHLSTIEGGMVCTNDKTIYQMLRMYRSHGMVREAADETVQQQYANNHEHLNPDFIFAYPAYNVRNTELGAVIGRNQLKRLDRNNKRRTANHEFFLERLNSARFRTDFELEGSCNYAFNVVLKKPNWELRDRLEQAMEQAGIEFRRGSSGGGNQMRQPYLKEIIPEGAWKLYPEVEHVHFFGWYIGNFPSLERGKLMELCDLLNNV